MGRRLLIVVALLAGLAAAVVPALAADRGVTSTPGNTWSEPSLTIPVGDSVSFRNDAHGFHDVHFTDGGRFDDGSSAYPPTGPAAAWPGSPTRTFTQAGTYHFYCSVHGDAQGDGTEPHRCRDAHRADVYAGDDSDVLVDEPQCLASDAERYGQTTQIVVHEHDVGRFTRDVGRTPEGH